MQAALHDAYAADYDQQVSAYGSYLAEDLFGLCYQAIQPGQVLLDAGIGSGLCAALFAKAGLVVHGFDFSPAMLDICRAKGIAVDLKQHDLLQAPWPYPPAAFDHLVCCGVLHFISGLEVIFSQAQRLLRPNGLFAFTSKIPGAALDPQQPYERQMVGEFEIFSHSSAYIEALLGRYSFERLKTNRCLVGEEIFQNWVVRKP
ncbi:MAG: methyltransferase domain-containing protein [Chloroflexota bacterium]